jgi:hypothetical protein
MSRLYINRSRQDHGSAHLELMQSTGVNGILGANFAVVRTGDFHTSKGFVGREKLIKMVNGADQTFWTWIVDGYMHGHKIIIHIDVPDDKWEAGKTWEEFLNSIELKQTGEKTLVKRQDFAEQRLSTDSPTVWSGPTVELPKRLWYLRDLTLSLKKQRYDNSESDEKFIESLEACLKTRISCLTDGQAKAELKEDRRQLQDWLRDRRNSKYPELDFLHRICGALQYVNQFLKKSK